MLRAEAGYWRAMHRKAVERERALEEELKAVRAKLSLRERQLFERKSERRGKSKGEGGSGAAPKGDGPRRGRGQQRGTAGHGRRGHDNLPGVVEERDLDPEDCVCPRCGDPLKPEGGAETSEVVEVEVKAYRRIIRRRRHRRTCECPDLPLVITAPPAPKLFPKGAYGISFWVHVVLEKFNLQRPLHRALTALRLGNGLDVSRGTVTGGLKRMSPLFEPLYDGIIAENLTASHWHADETRWFVFVDQDGEGRYRTWFSWVFLSATSVVFRIDPTRSADVPLRHFGESCCGILSVDRYSAYKVLLDLRLLVLAFCWSHVRRDFLAVAKDWKEHETWAFDWVRHIGELYRLNDERLSVLDDVEARLPAQRRLEQAVDRMEKRRDEQLAAADLHPACRKVLVSLTEHWSGLVIFVEHPDVPMDNNAAEREQREEVIGRRNYHGSGAPWSATLAAMLFSVFRTLLLWRIDVRQWLTAYFTACADNGGKPPPDPSAFLPWNMTEAQLDSLRMPTPNKGDTS
jgi:transposase